MARITVEDCIETVENRFELVILASQRAQAILAGSKTTIEKKDDKEAVIALREIAEGKMDIVVLKEAVINKYRKNSKLQGLFKGSVKIVEGDEYMDFINQEIEHKEIRNDTSDVPEGIFAAENLNLDD